MNVLYRMAFTIIAIYFIVGLKIPNTNKAYISLRDMVCKKGGKEGCNKIVNALHITACWVTHGPNEEHSLKSLLDAQGLKQRHIRHRARYIYKNVSEQALVFVCASRRR
jgi:hypothetical protein